MYEEYTEVIDFLEQNEEKLPLKKNTLTIYVNKQNEEYLRQFIKCYFNTKATYDYLEINYGLSTGEYNFLNLFGNMHYMYWMVKVKYVLHIADKNPALRSNSNILLLFDEADLSFHPRWQRYYVKWLVEYANQLWEGFHV